MRKDITGLVVGELTVVEFVGVKYPEDGGKGVGMWKCQCSCGATKNYKTSVLTRGDVQSCGGKVHLSEASKKVWQKRGTPQKSNKKEYASWANAKQRVTNPNYPYYDSYSKLGMDEEWLQDFNAFLEHIGPCPDPSLSLDRIDNTLGYYPGNVRWATKSQQSQNVSKRKDNKSGVTGVVDTPDESKFVVIWRNGGKRYSKSFNYSYKYSYEEAFRLACEYREQIINILNELGAEYSPSHGKTTNLP